jgi:hypothetical protein
MKKDNKSLLFERMQYLNPDFKKPLKEGVEDVKVVNEDDKWIQKAVNPEHKGFCTPMSKDTCTPPRKALAKRFKKGIEDEGVEDMNMGAEMGSEEPKEKTPEEKLQELTAKVDELYALLHGEEEGDEEEVPEMGAEKSPEGLTEWNFDKKKGEKKTDGKKKYNFEKKEDEESEEHEASETPAEEKKEHAEKKELGEVKANAGKKVPVAAIAKVGK